MKTPTMHAINAADAISCLDDDDNMLTCAGITDIIDREAVLPAVKELVEALAMFCGYNPLHSFCHHAPPDIVGRHLGTWSKKAEDNARAVLAKYKELIP